MPSFSRFRFVALSVVVSAIAVLSAAVVEFGPVGEAQTRTGARRSPATSEKGPATPLQVRYRGTRDVVGALKSNQAQARALASADLSNDAAPDLIAGYSWAGTGIVTIQRGNREAFAPKDDAVFERMQKGYNPDALLPVADTYRVPEGVDLLQVGDFNHDNRKDILAAARGGDLFLLPGDGQGGLGAPERVDLPGSVTALTAGEFRAADGRMDAMVAIDGPNGHEVLVFDGADGVTGDPISFHLSGKATALAIDVFDNDPFRDIVVAAGGELDIIHGWGRKQNTEPQSRIERMDLGYNALDVATGFFVWNRAADNEIAVLSDDGTVHIMAREDMDERPFTDEEIQMRGRSRGHLVKQNIDIEDVPSWGAAGAAPWLQVREFASDAPAAASVTIFQRSHISFGSMDDIMLSEEGQNLASLRQDVDKGERRSGASDLVREGLDADQVPTAFLAFPQKVNGERDLIVMRAGSVMPVMIALAPTATITVDRTDDPSGGSLAAASVCGAGANDCSLRGAVQFANANPGTAISLGSATYTLNTNGAGGCVVESAATGNTIGDLEINKSTTITGTGAASTVIDQIGTGDAGHPGDRAICMDVPLAPNLTFAFSALTIAGGRDSGINGGGGILGGAKSTTLTLTNVTFANNQTSGASFGGGGATVTGGDMNVTNCTFGAANLPGASRTDLTLGNATSTSGGGLAYTSGDPAGSSGAVGTLTETVTTYTHNTAASGCCGGGGLDIFGLNLSVPTVNISTTSFSNNQANNTASGGGLINEGGNVTIGTSSFTSNSALNRGGAIYCGGGSTLLDGTSPSLTLTGNTASSGGTSISTASLVTVAGTNLTLDGSIEVSGNGTWTNNGSTLAPTDIVIDGGTFNCSSSTMNVSGNISLGPSGNNIIPGTFNGSTCTVNLAGNFSFNSTAGTALNAGTSTFNFTGTGAQSISNNASITFNNLTDSNTTQPLTFNNSLGVNGTLSATGANTRLAPVAGTIISGTGTLNGTGTAQVTRTTATADFSSQYTIANKTLTNLTVEYIGAAAQTGSALIYGGLKINNASGVSLAAGTATVNAMLTLTAGPLAVGTSTLDINNASSVIGGSLTSAATGTVNYGQGTNGQPVITADYGNLTFSNFQKILPAATIGIAGTFTPGSGTGHTVTGNTISFNGSGAQTIPVFTYNNLSTATGGTKMLGGSIVVPGNITIGAGSALDASANNFNIDLAGNFTNHVAAANFVPRAGTVTFNGGGAQAITGSAASQTFNNVVVNKGGGALSAGGSTTSIATNDLTMTAGTFTAPATLDVNGNLLLSGGTLTAGTNITSAGNWTNNGGTFTPGANTVTFDGGAGQVIGGTAASQTFNNFVVNKGGGTLSTGGSTTSITTNNLTMTLGTFTAPAALDINGGATLNGGTLTAGTSITEAGNWAKNGGAFTAAAGTVTFDGAAAQSIGGSTSTAFNTLTVSNTGSTVTLGIAATEAANLSVTSGTFDLGAFTANRAVAAGGALTISPGATLKIGGAGTLPTNFTTYSLGTTSPFGTVEYGGGSGQTIAAVNYGNLTSSGGGARTLASTGTIGIAGTFTPGVNSYTITSSTVEYNGTSAQSLPSGFTTYNNLTLNNAAGTTGFAGLTVNGLLRIQAGTFTSSSSYNNVQIDSGTTLAGVNGTTIGVTGNWTNNGGTFTPNGNTVSFNGGAAQAIDGTSATQSFNNFVVNKNGNALTTTASTIGVNNLTLTSGNFTAPATLNVGGNVLLTTGNLTAGTDTNVVGNWTNNGATFTPGGGTVTLNGATLQTIGGSVGTTFGKLTFNNNAGFTLAQNETVSGQGDLTNGIVTTGANMLIFAGAAGSPTRTNGYVDGRVAKVFTATGTFAYAVGTANGYTPFTAIVTTLTTNPSTLVAFPVQQRDTNPAIPADAINRYWDLALTGALTADLTFQYLAADLPLTNNEAGYTAVRDNGSVLKFPIDCGGSPAAGTACVTPATYTITVKGANAFSKWLAGAASGPTASGVSVSGRVMTQDGGGVTNAQVTITDSAGVTRTIITGRSGQFNFDDVPTGSTYIVSVSSQRFTFAPQVIAVTDQVAGLSFTAQP